MSGLMGLVVSFLGRRCRWTDTLYSSFWILGMAVLVMSMALLCRPIAWYGYLVASVDIFAYMSVPGA